MSSQDAADLVKNAVWLAEDEVVGEMENDKARSSKPSIATAVTRGPGEVRGSIGFDDEASLFAEEIDDKGSDRMLASEFGAHDLSVAQHLPKQPFRWGGAASQGSRHAGRGSWQPWHECLSATSHRRLLLDDAFGSPLRPGEGLGVRSII